MSLPVRSAFGHQPSSQALHVNSSWTNSFSLQAVQIQQQLTSPFLITCNAKYVLSRVLLQDNTEAPPSKRYLLHCLKCDTIPVYSTFQRTRKHESWFCIYPCILKFVLASLRIISGDNSILFWTEQFWIKSTKSFSPWYRSIVSVIFSIKLEKRLSLRDGSGQDK